MNKKRRIETGGGGELSQNPFAALDAAGLPEQPKDPPGGERRERNRGKPKKPGRRGRLDIRREKGGRGGKLVTVIAGFQGVSARELEEWARELRKQCGVGGSLKERAIELQGDHRETARDYFEQRGFRPVFTGG